MEFILQKYEKELDQGNLDKEECEKVVARQLAELTIIKQE